MAWVEAHAEKVGMDSRPMARGSAAATTEAFIFATGGGGGGGGGWGEGRGARGMGRPERGARTRHAPSEDVADLNPGKTRPDRRNPRRHIEW